jgi:hypothetical protein
MKLKLTIIIIVIGLIIPLTNYAQCNVSKEAQGDGSILYFGTNKSIYRNEDLENGVQSLYLQVITIQKEKNSSLLQYIFQVSCYTNGDKIEVLPITIKFTFVDETSIQLNAVGENKVGLIELSNGRFKTNTDLFTFTLNDFLSFQKKDVKSITVTDKMNASLIANRNINTVKELINCIASSVSY